ncbi:MAG: putative toxin-antitoxin system toxin component, PIN family [Acidobacteriaceae bacterium]|nr:putative toxin-antitoxin system toxin component, PIN family [Acidobacteriaceae bacterium]
MTDRVVFDTTTVVSALLFPSGRLAWLRQHWSVGGCVPLLSAATAAELTRVLRYPKFRLSEQDVVELLAEYLPFCEIVDRTTKFSVACRDAKDQPFLDLAHSGKAQLLVSGDSDLLALAEQTDFIIETPEAYRIRIEKQRD